MITTTVLAILDGWGLSRESAHNGVLLSKTPNYDRILAAYPWTELQASEEFVGLPKGQMGNSEVGHLNIGAGRLVKQLLPRISEVFETPEYIKAIPALQNLIRDLQFKKSKLHLMCLLSDGGIHSHQSHLEAIYDVMVSEGIEVIVHAFTDGRDTPPSSAIDFIQQFCQQGKRTIHTIGGRYYGMDRDKRWDRVRKAYDTIVHGNGVSFPDPIEYIQASYVDGITDEFIVPAIKMGYEGFKDGDAVFMVNFRADRARQLLTSILDPEFKEFDRGVVPNISKAVGMVSYSETLDGWMDVCFAPEALVNTLGEYVASKGLRQLRVAETEKYAHVTFFLNGGREVPFEGEDRMLIPSPNVATYDLQPTMSADQITEAVLSGIGTYDLIVVNYANPDMVGHTGMVEASVKAVESIDLQLGGVEAAILQNGGAMIITADHGNVETLWDDKSGQPHTAHTMNPVPFIVVQKDVTFKLTAGALCDVAPTVLRIMKQEKPAEMTGKCLIE
ncbi:2,3-bisphosphoglycerate-independent phosphoglycerate mutase [Candidatus Bodocaedibacter vickermanii]|uniref:2,3-bisphosphoglycerate-independent phosphoglycerate mutase n=1 Tax=Candidatus Bodocaedibacter vickermanii TaxID=2741701 RepID=A0A7L9RSP8_9PROT|nr:2,3-bisphosphoglycerate-independent phosphoglycerate mutase [Candidatus Paracaedibacteraceae bacterium 'Lake Konstanz']